MVTHESYSHAISKKLNSKEKGKELLLLLLLLLSSLLTLRLPIAGLTVMILLNLRYKVCKDDNSHTTVGISRNLL